MAALKTRKLSNEEISLQIAELKALLEPKTEPKKEKKERRKNSDEVKYATQDQMAQFFATIKQSKKSVWQRTRDIAMFRVAYHHGLRASEIGRMTLLHYRVKSGRIFIGRLKGSNSGEYRTPKSCKLALDAWLQVRGYDDGPLFPSRRGAGISDQMIDVLMKEYATAAEWQSELRHEHTLKHSCAVHLLEGGPGRPRMDIVAVQDWLGHVNIASTMVYAKITNRVRDEVGSQIGAW